VHICLVSQEYPPHTAWGGIAIYTAALARMCAAGGHRVSVISRTAPGAPAVERLDGATVFRAGAGIWRKRLTGRTADRLMHAHAVRKCLAAIDGDRRVDVVEAPDGSLEAAAILQDDGFGARTVVQCHGSNVNGEMPSGLLGPAHRLDWQWSLRQERQLLARAPYIVAPSAATQALLIEVHGVDPRRIVVIHHGVDTRLFSPPESRTGPLVVGFAARLEGRKGVDVFWRVAEAIGPGGGVHFRLKGAMHPARRREMESRLKACSAWVSYEPAAPHAAMPAFYRGIDVLLQASRFESFGLACAEAMACGVVVMVGRGGAGPEIVDDGVNGFVLDDDGAAERAVALVRRFAADRGSAHGIGLAARRRVLRDYTLNASVERKLELYRQVASS
jgi:glycogen(starch) synthase